jgi:hypothetical protein
VTILQSGSASYRIVAVERDGRWVVHAEREDTRVPFGIDCTGATRGEAIDRLRDWLEWQREHAAALAALQVAERIYHRTVAGTFASQTAAPSAEIQKEALDALDAARIRLDDVRSRAPEPS